MRDCERLGQQVAVVSLNVVLTVVFDFQQNHLSGR